MKKVADAARFAFPELPLLVHLYHPFQSNILARVLDHLHASVQAQPRRVVVTYLLYTSAIDEVLARLPGRNARSDGVIPSLYRPPVVGPRQTTLPEGALGSVVIQDRVLVEGRGVDIQIGQASVGHRRDRLCRSRARRHPAIAATTDSGPP